MSVQNAQTKPDLKYTICFLLHEDKVLLLYRSREPNKNKWNGVGGKIEAGETPLASIQREIQEEVGIDIPLEQLQFTGIVTWEIPDQPLRGMYVFITKITHNTFTEDASTREGILSWKPLSWIADKEHTGVVSNISHFLPQMLQVNEPCEYIFTYNHEGTIQKMLTKKLTGNAIHTI